MSTLRSICRPNTVFSSFLVTSRHHHRYHRQSKPASFRVPSSRTRVTWLSVGFDSSTSDYFNNNSFHNNNNNNQRRTLTTAASNWSNEKSPYETLELEKDANGEQIKVAYRRLAKYYHPDVYDGKGTLDEGETAENRFIKIQAAYELLTDEEKRGQYDRDNRVNPMKASEAWMEWLIKKRKAFDQRGDMAITAWAEQQQLEMNLRARRLARSKVDPEEERRILAREKKASKEYFSATLKRHTLVLKKRDLMRKKSEDEKKKVISQLLAAEGLELASEDEEAR